MMKELTLTSTAIFKYQRNVSQRIVIFYQIKHCYCFGHNNETQSPFKYLEKKIIIFFRGAILFAIYASCIYTINNKNMYDNGAKYN